MSAPACNSLPALGKETVKANTLLSPNLKPFQYLKDEASRSKMYLDQVGFSPQMPGLINHISRMKENKHMII